MSHMEVSARMCGPDALSLIQLLQEEDLIFKIDSKNPRIIHIAPWEVESVRELVDDHFKEGFIDVYERGGAVA